MVAYINYDILEREIKSLMENNFTMEKDFSKENLNYLFERAKSEILDTIKSDIENLKSEIIDDLKDYLESLE